MRVLITTQPAHGHLHALIPLARALRDAGHDVAFASSASFRPVIEGTGFQAFAAGHDWLESEFERAFPEIRALPPGSDRAGWFVMNLFAGPLAQQMATDVLALSRDWRAEVIVRDPNEYGGCIAAECLDIPHASSSKGLFPDPALTSSLIGRSLAAARHAHGLPPDPDAAMLTRFLDLAFVPPGFLDQHDVVPSTVHFLRPVPFNNTGADVLPDWVRDLPPQPTVHATLGTVFNRTPDATAALSAVIAGLRDEPINLLVTVGRNADPAQFGNQPANVRIERYLPHALLLPYCDLVVTHGGFNTVMAVLERGIPLVAIPLGADQFRNASRCATHGLGIAIDRDRRTPDAIRAAVRTVLGEPSFRRAANTMQAHMAELPGPEHAVELLEQLIIDRAPIRASASGRLYITEVAGERRVPA